MTCRRGFLGIGACALMLLGLSTNASATVTGAGCILAGLAGQTAPTTGTINSVATFQSACTTTSTNAPTFFAFNTNGVPNPDNIVVNSNGLLGASTVNTLLQAPGTNIACTPSASAQCNTTIASAGAAGSAVGAISSWFMFLYTANVVNAATSELRVVDHDDGVSLYVDGVIRTPNVAGSQTLAAAAAPQGSGNGFAAWNLFNLVGAGNHTVALIWDECCGSPGVLLVNLPNEATTVVPEPASLILLGSTILGIAGFLKRRTHV